MGIGFGVMIQVLMILYHTARPYMEFEVRKVPGPGDHDKMYLSVTPHAGVVFPAVTHVRAVISKKSVNQDFPRYHSSHKQKWDRLKAFKCWLLINKTLC